MRKLNLCKSGPKETGRTEIKREMVLNVCASLGCSKITLGGATIVCNEIQRARETV